MASTSQIKFDHQGQRNLTPSVAPTQFFFQVGNVSPIIRKGLENFQSFVEVFIGGIILDDLEEEGPENTQAIPLKTKSQGQQSCLDPLVTWAFWAAGRSPGSPVGSKTPNSGPFFLPTGTGYEGQTGNIRAARSREPDAPVI